MALDATALGQVAGGLLAGGGVTAIATALGNIAKLINDLTQDDPVKQARANREFINLLRKEVGKLEGVTDATEIVDAFSKLYESM